MRGYRLDNIDLDTRSQWIGRRKQSLSYGIQIALDDSLMHDIYAHVHLDDIDLVLEIENVCKSRPPWLFFSAL